MTELYDSDKVLEGNMMPIQVLIGEQDKPGPDDLGGVWENQRMRDQMPYWLERNGLEDDVDEALTDPIRPDGSTFMNLPTGTVYRWDRKYDRKPAAWSAGIWPVELSPSKTCS